MNVRAIVDENDYQICTQNAHRVHCEDKRHFCLNFYYVFYAEIELCLNRYFIDNSRKQWSLLFVDYNFMPSTYSDNARLSPLISFYSQAHILTILHNAKVKYCCLNCDHEWTTARGRAIFQAEIPTPNKHNILFAYLFTQKCEKCRRETDASWYLDEATRVMRNVSRILLEKFYPHRRFLPSSENEELDQRPSNMKTQHHRDLCEACEEGSCYSSIAQNR